MTIRHASGHRIVAFLEILSPGNKDRTASIQDLVNKIDAALMQGINVMMVDLFPPGGFDPHGLHGAVWARYGAEEYLVPTARPLTVCSYRAVAPVEAYIEHMAFGEPLPEMPLFLDVETYIYVPLEQTYRTAFEDLPIFLREARGDVIRVVTIPVETGSPGCNPTGRIDGDPADRSRPHDRRRSVPGDRPRPSRSVSPGSFDHHNPHNLPSCMRDEVRTAPCPGRAADGENALLRA